MDQFEELDISKLSSYDEVDFVERIYPVYNINKVSKDNLLKDKMIDLLDNGYFWFIYWIYIPKKKFKRFL